jgi:hypothetical protein
MNSNNIFIKATVKVLTNKDVDDKTCDQIIDYILKLVEKIEEESRITTKNGLLYKDDEVINLPLADTIARKHGFLYAELFVKHLEKKQKEEEQKEALKKDGVF